MCTPAVTAHTFAEALSENAELHMVQSAHIRTDPEMMHKLQRSALQLAT